MSSTISAADLFNLIAADLQTKVEALGGIFSRAEDPFHRIELLSEAPGRFRVILIELGEQPVPLPRDGGIQEITYQVTVSQNRGLPMLRGAHLAIARSAQDKSLLERCCEVRDWLRGLPLPANGATSKRLDYRGRQPVVIDGAQLDAYQLDFRTIAALPSATARP